MFRFHLDKSSALVYILLLILRGWEHCLLKAMPQGDISIQLPPAIGNKTALSFSDQKLRVFKMTCVKFFPFFKAEVKAHSYIYRFSGIWFY